MGVGWNWLRIVSISGVEPWGSAATVQTLLCKAKAGDCCSQIPVHFIPNQLWLCAAEGIHYQGQGKCMM